MAAESDELSVLVTGANSGLGLAICCRLVDEFLYTRPKEQTLLIIPTTRSQAKSDAAARQLQQHVDAAEKQHGQPLQGRVRVRPEQLDLNSLHSVRELARRLKSVHGMEKLDAAILNAGMGGWNGIAFWHATFRILTDLRYAVTFPTYKLSDTGLMLKRQLPLGKDCAPADEPPTGEVFCANLFGHYLLCRWLAPLMANSPSPRTIWISSLEAYAHSFDPADFQGIRNPLSYESSKRVTDVLALTSRLPSASPWVKSLYSAPAELQPSTTGPRAQPKMYVAHPGIIATGIMPLSWLFTQLMLAAFYLARWLGSQWHPIAAYKGACAPVWLALASDSLLAGIEARDGVGKWGSATDFGGDERVERTEVEGWGYGGVPGDASVSEGSRKGRLRGAKDLTREERVRFEELGRECWAEMERLRGAWEAKLDAAGL